jgi:adenine phosphoribosyltransferase
MRAAIRDMPDFPVPGILFRDITPLLADAAVFREATDALAAPFVDAGITHVAGIESRGFILAAPVAQRLRAGFVPIRKRGKLPGPTVRAKYGLEYGTDELELHRDAFPTGSRVLIVDDVLATGGTALASASLVAQAGGIVAGFSFLVLLQSLQGAARLEGFAARALLQL